MHRGVRELIRWVEESGGHAGVDLRPPASSDDLSALEQQLGSPLPSDLRFFLARHNGGTLPSGQLLPAGIEAGTMFAALRELAEDAETDFLDPEGLLPFFRTAEESYLAFDRSAGPIPDTWPIVDFDPSSRRSLLVHRTFDGFCEKSLSDWTATDFHEDFTLDGYLRRGLRHLEVEPDVASAHATVAHALKRAGRPEGALSSYLRAARCVPTLPWCDWSAAKLAVLLHRVEDAFEALSRLCGPGPADAWTLRETSPGPVADLLVRFAAIDGDAQRALRLLEQLVEVVRGDDRDHVIAVRRALLAGEPVPRARLARSIAWPEDAEALRQACEAAYVAGEVREDDLLFDPVLEAHPDRRVLIDLLRIRREF